MSVISEQKIALRHELRRARASVENRAEKSARACGRLTEIPGWRDAACVLAYVNYRSEIETKTLLESLWKSENPHRRCILPLCLSDGGLKLAEIRSFSELAPGMCGILEPKPEITADDARIVRPEELDFVVLPGVGFDAFGGRLGQGGGYYDRLLPLLKKGTPTAGLAFACQMVDSVPHEPHDLQVKYVATEEKLWTAPTLEVWGILGGIASGKSLVSSFFRTRSVPVFDADQAGHALYDDPEIRRLLLARWGNQVLQPDGTFDRKRVAELVFTPTADGSESPELSFLNALFHPAIHERWNAFRLAALYSGHRLAILDAALLLESGWGAECDALLFVETPRERQISFALSRGWTLEELERRERNQFPLEKKRASATCILTNDGSPEELYAQLSRCFQHRTL